MESKYYVVKLSEHSNHIDSFVCVPRSWIKIILDKTPGDQKILISYPEEEPQKIKKRVETEEGSDKSWKHYWGTVVYSSDDYEDAERWITFSGISPKDNSGRGYPYIGNPPVQAAETEARIYQQSSPAASKENTSQPTGIPLKNNPNASIKLSLKRNLQSNNADEFYIKQLRIDEKTGGEREVPNHLRKPAAKPKELITDHQNVINQDLRTQDIISTAPAVLGYQSPRQTAMPFALQKSPNSHNQSCQLTNKLTQHFGTRKSDIRQPVDSNHNSQGSYFDVTNPIVKSVTNSPNRSCQASEFNQKRISVVPNEYLFQNCGTPEVSNERENNSNSNHGKVYTDMTNTQSAMQTSANYTNQLCQSSECSHKKERHIPNDYILQNHGQQKSNYESSAYLNDSEQRTNLLTRNTPSATQALKTLMNRRDEQRIHENQIITTHDNTFHQKSPRQEVNDKSQEIYHIDQKTYSEDVKKTPKYSQQLHVKDRLPPELDISQTFQTNKNISSPSRLSYTQDKKPTKYILKKTVSLEDNLSEITSKSCQLVEQSHLKRDASGYNVHVHINKIVVSRSKQANCADQISLPEFVTKNSSPVEQSTSSFVNESSPLYEKSNTNQDSPEYKVVVQQHPLINKIIITKSNEMEGNNEIQPSQSNSLYGQKAFNVLEDSQSTDRAHENNYSTAPTGYSQLNSGAPKRIVRTTTAGVPYIVNDYFPENVQNGPSTIQNCPNIENHSFQISKHLNDQHHTTVQQNGSKQASQRDITTVGRSTAVDRIDQRPRLQSIRKHKSGTMQNVPSFIENKLGQFAERLHENQALLLGNDYLIHNHGPGVHLARQPRNMNHYDPRACFRDPTKNVNPPNHIPPHLQHPANQTPRHSMQMPQQLNEKYFAPVHINHVPDQRIPQTHFVRPTIMNNIHQRSQPMPQNMPVAQNIPNSGNHSCCSCKCSNAKQVGPINQEQSYGDHRMHQSYVGRTNDGHYIKQSVHPHINTQNASFPAQNPFNTPSHTSAAYMNPIQEHCLPVVIDHAVQETSSREISAARYAEDNSAEQNIYNEANKEVRQHIHKSPKIPEQSLQYTSNNHLSPVKVIPGQSLQTEEIYIEDTNSTNCLRQNSHPTNNTEVPSTTRQDTSNADNIANSKTLAEHALMNDLKCIIQKMDSNLSKTYTLIDNANRIFVEYAESFKKTMKVVNEYYELKMNEAAAAALMNAKRAKDKRHKKKRLEKSRTDDDEHSNTI